MPFGIDNNVQYNAFVDFARKATSAKSIARVSDSTDSLGAREIQVQSHDRVGAFFRAGDVKGQNDATRTRFKETISAMFGGEDKIPQSVKDAMRFDKDFEQGKPLTARRIIAVKTAIDNLDTRYETAMQAARESVSELYKSADDSTLHFSDGSNVTREQLDTMMNNLVMHCIDDPAAVELVSKNMRKILLRGDITIRTPDSAMQYVDKLLDNISEIRAVAQKNQRIFKAGFDCLMALNGKPLPAGLFRSIIQIANTCKVNHLKGIKADSSPLVIHKGIRQLMENNLKVLSESQAERKLEGADERECANNLVTALMLAKCSDAGVRAIKAALESESAHKLNSFYFGVSHREFVDHKMSAGAQSFTQAAAFVSRNMLGQLKINAEMRLGTPENEVQSVGMYNNEVDVDEIDGVDIFSSLASYGKIEMSRQRESYIQETIKGEGQGVEKMREVIGEALGPEPPDPPGTMRTRFERNVSSMVNLHLATECKLLATGRFAESKFAQSCGSGITMKLGDQPLSNDPATARDQVVSFVTNGQTKSYAELNDPKMKNRVHLAMAMLSKGVIEATEKGQAQALDPMHAKAAMRPESDPNADQFELTLVTRGNDLQVKFKSTRKLTGLETRDPKGQFVRNEVGPNSTLYSDLSYTIKESGLQRLETLDFTQFDESEPQKVLDDDMPQKDDRLSRSLQGFRISESPEYSCFTRLSAQFD